MRAGYGAMNHQEEKSMIRQVASILPWKKWWFYAAFLLLMKFFYDTIDKNIPVSYDHVALGFQSEELMNKAFARGYHNRQKMEEVDSAKGDAQ